MCRWPSSTFFNHIERSNLLIGWHKFMGKDSGSKGFGPEHSPKGGADRVVSFDWAESRFDLNSL